MIRPWQSGRQDGGYAPDMLAAMESEPLRKTKYQAKKNKSHNGGGMMWKMKDWEWGMK